MSWFILALAVVSGITSLMGRNFGGPTCEVRAAGGFTSGYGQWSVSRAFNVRNILRPLFEVCPVLVGRSVENDRQTFGARGGAGVDGPTSRHGQRSVARAPNVPSKPQFEVCPVLVGPGLDWYRLCVFCRVRAPFEQWKCGRALSLTRSFDPLVLSVKKKVLGLGDPMDSGSDCCPSSSIG